MTTEFQPRNHQLQRVQSRDIYQANICTYNSHDDRESLVRDGGPGMLAACSLDEVHPETHGAKEGELKADREGEDDLVGAVDLQGST